MAAPPNLSSDFCSAASELAAPLLGIVSALFPGGVPPTQDPSDVAAQQHPAPYHLPLTDEAARFVYEAYPLTIHWHEINNAKLQAREAAKAPAAAQAEAAATRKSARQASRPTKAKKPWRALMKGKAAASGEDHDSDNETISSSSNESGIRPRTVGEVDVHVWRNVLPRTAINRLMKGKQHGDKATKSSSSSSTSSSSSNSRAGRNPWPGITSLIETLFDSQHATQVKHPYIAEISSRCDSAGPPQRLDLRLTSSGVQNLLTPAVIQAVEAIVFGLKGAVQFTGKVQWDTHLVIVLPGAPAQKFHCDSSRSWFYFTLIFPLTKDPPKAGRTEFWEKEDQPVVPVGQGDVLVFDGRRKHRGSANATARHVRVFLYIAVYSGTDWN